MQKSGSLAAISIILAISIIAITGTASAVELKNTLCRRITVTLNSGRCMTIRALGYGSVETRDLESPQLQTQIQRGYIQVIEDKPGRVEEEPKIDKITRKPSALLSMQAMDRPDE